MGVTVRARRPLYIVGAGDFGREMESLLEMIPPEQREWDIVGYLDDNPTALEGFASDYDVVGPVRGFEFSGDDHAILAISDSATREQVYRALQEKVQFASYLHPSVIVFKYVTIGEGTVIVSNCVISNSVRIGRFAIINEGTQIGHDSTIGDFCSLMSSVDLGGSCVIGEGAYIGTGATLIPGIQVGAGAKVGSGSVVIRNVKEKTTVFGNPAKLV
jgi:sugar O-acyltransferase (sialic acid O-acetyltransferase NeuD family)